MSELKDHEIQKIVNDLRNIGKKYGQHQCLRELIHKYIVPILKAPLIPKYEMEIKCEHYINNLCLYHEDCPNRYTIANYVNKCKTTGKVRVPMSDGVQGIAREVEG